MLYVRQLLCSPTAWGHVQGEHVRLVLQARMQALCVLGMSLAGVEQLDVSFARSAFVELARAERMRRGLCFTDIGSLDIVENLEAAALACEQPLTLWLASGVRVLGPQPSIGLRQMLSYVFSVPVARTSEAAARLQVKVPNASNKLKQLWQQGYVLRQERSASSGGVEYDYVRIGL